MQTSDENKEKYWLWDYYLIRYQILQNIMRIVGQIVRRITSEILGVYGLKKILYLGQKPVGLVWQNILHVHLFK